MIEHEYSLNTTVEGELLLFRTLCNNLDDNMFIVSVDSKGDFVSESSNRAQEKTFNLKPNQLDGLKLKDLLDKKTYETISDRYKECIKLNKPMSYDESMFIGTSEERFWNTTILPVIDKVNDTVKIFGISKEFTKLKTIEKELQKANETLEVQVKERTIQLTKTLEEIRKISMLDTLTGLFNRRKLDESLIYEIKYSRRYNEEFGLIILDIDYFKDVNDKYGHQVGDKVLIEFSNILSSNTRETDIVGRWGGEEFLIICPKSNLDEIDILAENIRKKIESYEFSKIKHKTASLGATVFQSDDTFDSLIKKVDDALYISKNNGRNNTTIS